MGRSRSRSYSRSRSPKREYSRSRSRSRSRRSRSRGGDEAEAKRASRDYYSIMVAALPDDISERELKQTFEKYGEIGDCFVPRFRDSNRGRGFAFVRFCSERDRDDCVDESERKTITLGGRDLRIE